VRRPAGRVATLVLALVACLGLVACAQLPTSGPVKTGRTEAPAAGTIQYDASRPSPGTQPRELVQGFLQAGAAGLSGDDFEVARTFLTAQTAAAWAPLSQVLVAANDEPQTLRVVLPDDATVEPAAEELADADRVSVVVEVVAVGGLDAVGAYLPEIGRAPSELTFGLARVDGEWRIESLPDGLLLTEGTFATVFRPVPVAFLSPDHEVLVPDVRYVPTRRAARYAVEQLLAGPVPWLADSVTTAVPDGLRVDTAGVVLNEANGNAEVHLDGADVPRDVADLLYAQLRQTLMSLPSVWGVTVWFGDTPYEPAADVQLPELPGGVGQTMIALSGGRLVMLTGEELVPHPAFAATDGTTDGSGDGSAGAEASGAPEATDAATAPEEPANPDEPDAPPEEATDTGATQPPDTGSWRAPTLAYGTDPDVAVVADEDLLLVRTTGEQRVLAQGGDLLAPSFDRFGWVWSGTADGVFAVRASDGERVDVAVGPDEADEADGSLGAALGPVLGVRVSRDGARVLVTRREGDDVVVSVHGIVRGRDDAPVSIGDGVALAAFDDVLGAVWADSTVAVTLGTSAGDGPLLARTTTVSGPTSSLSATAQPVWVAAGDGVSQVFVATGDGRLLARAATRGWSPLAEDMAYPSFPG